MAVTRDELHYDRRTGRLDRRRDFATRGPALRASPYVEGIRVSWGGIWGGVLSAMGLMLLLGSLGAAVGITAANAQAADGALLGLAATAWVGVSLLLALFVGGLVATRIGATYDRATGFWEGALVWIVTLLLGGLLASTGMLTLVDGALGTMSAMPDSGGGAPVSAQVHAIDARAAWFAFGGLVISLLASLVGALAGRRRAPTLLR